MIPDFEIEYLQSLLGYAVMAEDNYDNLDSYLFDVLGNDLPDESLNPLLSLIYQFALRLPVHLRIEKLTNVVPSDISKLISI